LTADFVVTVTVIATVTTVIDLFPPHHPTPATVLTSPPLQIHPFNHFINRAIP